VTLVDLVESIFLPKKQSTGTDLTIKWKSLQDQAIKNRTNEKSGVIHRVCRQSTQATAANLQYASLF